MFSIALRALARARFVHSTANETDCEPRIKKLTDNNNFDTTKFIMKTIQRASNIVIFFTTLAGTILLGGCAGMGSANTTSLLTAAGFRARTPQTPKQQEIYAALPAYQVQRATVPGKGVFYVYKDPNAGVAYVGREAEYQRYQQLAVQQQIAQNYYMAAQMEQAAAWQWYGAWGPRAFWW
jgi:hypothetical protein